jgi:1-acyl-sn-glycerol-3-phosphate acyltransferase
VNALIRPFKLAWIFSCLALATPAVAVLIILAALLRPGGHTIFHISLLWGWAVLAAAAVRPVVVGRDKINPRRSYIIVSNHQSHFDAPAIAVTLGLPFRWVAKKELRKVPLFGPAHSVMGTIFIDRSNRAEAIRSLNNGVRRLPSGTGVLFFAEGSRSSDGRIGTFKKGAFFTAVETGFHILPVTVNGSRRVLPKGSFDYRAGTIQVVVGDPIDPKAYTLDTVDQLVERTRKIIVANFNPVYPEKKSGES